MRVKSLLILFLFCSIIASDEPMNHDRGIIDHCKKYNRTENSTICLTCENKYFLYYSNNSCIPCNDSVLGQIRCEGNCDGSNYETTKFAFCEEGGCKKGYSNINGICFNCSYSSPGCSNCTFDIQENHTLGNFECHKCINNEYRLTEYGECEHCELYLCDECHYEENNDEAICDKCSDNAYNNSYGKCQECRWIDIEGGYCKVCSDNDTEYEEGSCRCGDGYKLFDNSKCLLCPYGC